MFRTDTPFIIGSLRITVYAAVSMICANSYIYSDTKTDDDERCIRSKYVEYSFRIKTYEKVCILFVALYN